MSSSFSMAEAWAKMGSNPVCIHPTVESVYNASQLRTKIEWIAVPLIFPIEKDKLPEFIKESKRILREEKEKYKEKFIQNQSPLIKHHLDSVPQGSCKQHYEMAQSENELNRVFVHFYRMSNASDMDETLCREVFFNLFERVLDPSTQQHHLICCLAICSIGLLTAGEAKKCAERMRSDPRDQLAQEGQFNLQHPPFISFCNAFSCLIESKTEEGMKILEGLLRDPDFKDVALQMVLVHCRNKSNFRAIEKILTDHVDIQHTLNSDTQLLFLDMQVQLQLRQGLYQEAEKTLAEYRAFPQGDSLRLARQAQIMIRQHKAGNNLAPAYITLNASWNLATTRQPLLPWFFHFEIGVIRIEFLWLVGRVQEAGAFYDDLRISTYHERTFAADCKDMLALEKKEQKEVLQYYKRNYYPSTCPELLSQVLELYDRAAPDEREQILETAQTLVILESGTVGRYLPQARFYLWKYSKGTKDYYTNEQQLMSCLLNNPGPDSIWIINHFFAECVDAGKAKHAFDFCQKWLSKYHHIPEVFIQFAKQVSIKKDQATYAIDMFNIILLEQKTALSEASRSDLFHAVGYLTGLSGNVHAAVKYIEQAHPEIYGEVNATLGGLYNRLRLFDESVRAFERGFFAMWLKANYKAFFSDQGIDWINEVYVGLYVMQVFNMHREYESRVIEHLNQFLDSMPIQTEWKRRFSSFLMDKYDRHVAQNQSIIKGKRGKSEDLSKQPLKVNTDFSSKRVYQEIKKLFIEQVLRGYQEIVSRYSKENGIVPIDTDWKVLAEEALALTEPKEILRKILQMKFPQEVLDNESLKKPFHVALKHLYKELKKHHVNREIARILMILSNNQYEIDLVEESTYKCVTDAYKYCLTDQPEMMKRSLESMDSKDSLVSLGMAVAHFAKDADNDPITAVFLKRLLGVNHVSNQAALYLLTWYKDRGNLIEIERFLTSEREAGIDRGEDFNILSRDLWYQIEYAKGNFMKVVEMVQGDLLKEPTDPFLSARLAFLMTTQFVQGSSVALAFQLLNQAETNFKKKQYPACLVYEFELMRMFFYLNLNMLPQACDIATQAREYSSYPVKTFVPELQSLRDNIVQGTAQSKQVDQVVPLIQDHFLEENFIPEYALVNCLILMGGPGRKVNKETLSKVTCLCFKYMNSPMSKVHKNSFALIKWWSLLLLSKKANSEEFVEMRAAVLDSRTPKLVFDYCVAHFGMDAIENPQQLLREWLIKYGATTPRVFSYLAQAFKQEGLVGQVLTVYKTLEIAFAKNVDLFYALACLTEGETRDAYLDKCVMLDPKTAFHYHLVALKASRNKSHDAHQYLETYYRAEYKRTCMESFWPNLQFTDEHIRAVPVYLELLFKKYQNEQDVAAHINQLFNEFRTPSAWLHHFKQELDKVSADRNKKHNRNRKEKKPEDQAEMEEKIRQGRAAFLKEQEENYRRLMQQENERQRQMEDERKLVPQAAQPAAATPRIAQDEIDNRHRLMNRRAMDKEELRRMLDAGQSAIPRRSRFTLENALKMADDIAKESRKIPNPEPVLIPQPKVRERYIPTGQNEIVLPIATTVLTPANPAAAPRVYHQDVFSIVTDHENARLRQAYTCLSNMEGILQRAGNHEYPPELHGFIIQRALMYQLLRLGECLFPQSKAVRKHLSQNYQITMEKIGGREMLAKIRNQLRHEFRNVTLPRVLRVCEELLKSNLKKNIQTWHEYSIKPQNVSAAVKTSLPESCQVTEGMASVPALGFLMGELKKLGALLDKIEDDVLAMNPDLVATVKMSVCILGEMAKTERRIRGLDQFIEPSNQVAHEFGEDCEFYTTDEVSLFNIKPYVAMAKNIYKDFCK